MMLWLLSSKELRRVDNLTHGPVANENEFEVERATEARSVDRVHCFDRFSLMLRCGLDKASLLSKSFAITPTEDMSRLR